ncbi:MAG: ABC transporter ATP-binding protein [Thermoleophilaceae bacterium]
MSLLAVQGISRRFGGLVAVDNVSFEVDERQIFGVIGPNGAGKSTLFTLLSGFARPSAGRFYYRGADVTGWRPDQAAAAGVARTFQLMRTFGSMTVLENVMVGAHLRQRSRRRARAAAEEVLETTRMTELADVPASGLTAASRKRLELARALATQPKVLLLDEVLSGLTPREAAEAVQIVRGLPDRGVTTLMVEHVMEVIMPLCDRVVVLHHGRKIGEGPPEEVAADPEVVEAYLGGGRA